MWPDGGPVSGPRGSSGSEVVIINNHTEPPVIPDMSNLMANASREVPNVSNMNISNARNIHLGTKIVTVTQNVHNNEVVAGRFLGLELVSPHKTKRVRCCVAVFICWALVIVAAITFYLIYYAFTRQIILDIDVSCPRYLWEVVKKSTRIERISCTVAVVLVLVSIALTLYFKLWHTSYEEPDVAPHEWYITRDMWLAEPYNNTYIEPEFEPLRLVIIQHSVSTECHKFIHCASEIRNLQTYFINKKYRDIPYNFLIGNDGRVYEGRGWQMEGAHTYKYNRCSLGLGFIGDYRENQNTFTRVTDAQINRTHMLLAEGVRRGFLRPGYQVVGALDVQDTASPGSNLYHAIQNWEHYDHENRYRNKTCEVINSMPFSDGNFSTTTQSSDEQATKL